MSTGAVPTTRVFGLDIPTHLLVDILNAAYNGMYDRKKEASVELASVDLHSDTREVAIANAVNNFDSAESCLYWLKKIDQVRQKGTV